MIVAAGREKQMVRQTTARLGFFRVLVIAIGLVVSGCSHLPGPEAAGLSQRTLPDYRIGPLDILQIVVWQTPEVTTTVPVRPDGRISIPLIDDVEAAGKTPSELAHALETRLKDFVKEPAVTVIVHSFNGPLDQQIKVIGEVKTPSAIPYQAQMTTLDVLIKVGGLTEFAAGNGAVLVRGGTGRQHSFGLRLDDLLKDGDISANVPLLPGDVVIIPQSWL